MPTHNCGAFPCYSHWKWDDTHTFCLHINRFKGALKSLTSSLTIKVWLDISRVLLIWAFRPGWLNIAYTYLSSNMCKRTYLGTFTLLSGGNAVFPSNMCLWFSHAFWSLFHRYVLKTMNGPSRLTTLWKLLADRDTHKRVLLWTIPRQRTHKRVLCMTALFVCTARFDGYSDRKQRFHELALLAHKSSQICARTVRERFMGYSGEKSSFTCGSPFMCCICSCHYRGPQNLRLVGPPRTASPMRFAPFKFALFSQLALSPPFGGVHI